MVDFGSGQGPSAFCNRRHSGPIPRIAEKRERSPGPKDAVSGWALVSIRCQTSALHNIFKKSTKFLIDRFKYTLYNSIEVV